MSLENYKSQFEQFLSGLSNEPQLVLKERKKAFDKFTEIGFPNRNDETWQYTDLSPILDSKFSILETDSKKISENIFSEYIIPNSNRIILVDGSINEEFSDYGNSIIVKNSVDAPLVNNFKINNDSTFISLNTAFTANGYSIEIDSSYNSEIPLHIINITTDRNDAIQNHQQNNILIGRNSSIIIIEDFINYNNDKVFSNIVNKVELKENSNLNYVTFQNNNISTYNLNHFFIKQLESSNYNAQFLIKNGTMVRNEIEVKIEGENCYTNFSGLALLDGKDHIENYTSITHNEPNCNSRQLFKYILKESSEGVFNGLVKVQPGAQQTNSQQTNRNILLSNKALMNSNPQLEIYADDVKCSHGSATGELDDEVIFYLRSRGLDIVTAKSLLIEGFAKDVIDQIKNEPFKDRISNILLKWLAN